MEQRERQIAIEKLILEMNGKLDDYNDCLKSDAIFEIRKKLRLEIRRCQEKIEELQQMENADRSESKDPEQFY